MKKTVVIVGFGRFARTLVRLFDGDFDLAIFSQRKHKNKTYHGARFVREHEIFEHDVIIYAVPINAFEAVIKKHAPGYRRGQTIIEVLSVKKHPVSVLKKTVRVDGVHTLSTHPMFGPDSSKHGFQHLPMIMCPSDSPEVYNYWKSYFISKGLRIIEMTADEHDREAADSLALTHTIGRMLELYGFKPTRIDSLGAKKLKEIMDQVTNDSWELYEDMIKYNPYARNLIKKIQNLMNSIRNKI